MLRASPGILRDCDSAVPKPIDILILPRALSIVMLLATFVNNESNLALEPCRTR